MANIYAGKGVLWGVDSSTSTAFGASGTYAIQSRDYARKATKTEIKDGSGNTVALVYNDQVETATFEYVALSATVNGAATVTMPAIGDKVTITDATYTSIAGTTWYVDDVSAKSTNKDALMVTVNLSKYPNVS